MLRKVCKKCNKELSVDNFYKDKRNTDGLYGHCKECHKLYNKTKRAKKWFKEYYKKNKKQICLKKKQDYIKDPVKYYYQTIKYKFGLSKKDYQQLLEKQKGVCAICGKQEESIRRGKSLSLAVDHCHKTGKIRGLLCNKCNRALGLLNLDDNTEILERIKLYLS